MAKPSKIVPALQDAASPQPIKVGDLQNLVIAARHALAQMDAVSLGHVAASIARIEAIISAQSKQPTATDGTNKAP